jgi:glycosyltransferase involved in cell wall biosynthesis
MRKYRTVSIIIPCFNESRTIVELLNRVRAAATLGLKKEIIVVEDGSTDDTRKVLKKYRYPIKLILNRDNQGKGAALKSGFLLSRGDVVLVQDADLEYDPEEYHLLLEPIVSGKADVVYGSRFMGDRPHRVVYYWHAVLNHFLTTFSNMLTNINLTDMETCYKAFDGRLLRSLAPSLESPRFGFEPEITAKIAKIPGIRFYEVGISYYGRTYQEGKHIRWLDGLKAVWQVIKFNVFS